ncbi:MATE family efflux transporter [Pollutimonas nitritireducens]|uniref:Multidrug-efflux transporter n=1 Tax=Pollutimonas nitritireducens TaxID=2045209 RepID=A0A2N4UFK4_9BURK|nr:MATE family efflux transporter [Pollutimonas nitritireducens]PLC53786.1 MATE family efflux transporter [Pollutimonas nitritireducens]
MTTHAPESRRFGFYIKEILRQAWPVLISSWAGIAFGVIDTAMAGHVSAADLQAMALAVSIYITIFVGLMGVVHALIPIIAQHFGGQRYIEVGRAWGQGVWLAFGLSVIGAATMLFPDAWLAISGHVDPAVRSNVTWYLRALILALPASLVFRSVYALGTAVSRPKVVMAINLASIAFKLFFNWIFMLGKLGLPALGAAGAGLSTAVVAWLTLAAGLWAIYHDPFYKRFKPTLGVPNWTSQKELLRLGIPMGASYLVEVCAFTFMALLVAREGMYVTGGHQIMSNLAALCYMMPMAVGIATASLTAQAIGARDMSRARSTGMAGVAVVATGACLTAILLIAGKSPILRAYTDDLQVAAVAVTLMQVLPWFHLCDAMQCIGSYLLRAYKVAVVPLLLQIVALTGIGLIGGWWLGFGPAAGALQPVVAYIMPNAPIGAASMWMMALMGLALSATLLFAWYGHIVRRHARAIG